MYRTLVVLHLLAAVTWLGGIAFLALVGAPVLRRLEDAALRQHLFDVLGQRFRLVGWSAVALAVASGAALLWTRGWLDAALLSDPAFWRSGAGTALALKLATVTLMLAVTAWHDVVDGPRASAAVPGSPASIALRRRAMRLARVTGVLALLVLVAGVWLSRAP
jgi:uncharacterized membrane protein